MIGLRWLQFKPGRNGGIRPPTLRVNTDGTLYYGFISVASWRSTDGDLVARTDDAQDPSSAAIFVIGGLQHIPFIMGYATIYPHYIATDGEQWCPIFRANRRAKNYRSLPDCSAYEGLLSTGDKVLIANALSEYVKTIVDG